MSELWWHMILFDSCKEVWVSLFFVSAVLISHILTISFWNWSTLTVIQWCHKTCLINNIQNYINIKYHKHNSDCLESHLRTAVWNCFKYWIITGENIQIQCNLIVKIWHWSKGKNEEPLLRLKKSCLKFER